MVSVILRMATIADVGMLDIGWLVAVFGEWSVNYAGQFVEWLDIGVWSGMFEDSPQWYVGL